MSTHGRYMEPPLLKGGYALAMIHIIQSVVPTNKPLAMSM